MMLQTIGIRPKAASSTMTKNEYQTDIHELIQIRPPPTEKRSTEKKLAFDKCTLLSSQRSDAPAFQLLSLRRRATSLSYTPRLACQIATAGHKTPPRLTCRTRVEETHPKPKTGPLTRSRSDGVVRCLRGARPSGLPLYPLGRTTRTLRGTSPPVESSPHPGRVAHPHPQKHAELTGRHGAAGTARRGRAPA
jgi:hypothetical protein